MVFKLRTSPIDIDVNAIMTEVTKAVRTRAESLTIEFKSKIIATIYSSVRRRTGAIGRSVKPFVFMDSTSVTLGFDIDLSEAPYAMTQMMMTVNESPFKVISAGSHMLTVPLNAHISGRSVKDMNLSVIPTMNNVYLGYKTGSGSNFKPQFVLEHSVKVPKRIKMYDIMDEFEDTARVEIQKSVQDVVNRGLKT
jgi:hypothetical protein